MTTYVAGQGRPEPYMPEYSTAWRLGGPVAVRRTTTREDVIRRKVGALVDTRQLSSIQNESVAREYVAGIEREVRRQMPPQTAAERAASLARYGGPSRTAPQRLASSRSGGALTAAERAARLRRYDASARSTAAPTARQARALPVPGGMESYDTAGRYKCEHCTHPPARFSRSADGYPSIQLDHGQDCPTRRTYGRG